MTHWKQAFFVPDAEQWDSHLDLIANEDGTTTVLWACEDCAIVYRRTDTNIIDAAAMVMTAAVDHVLKRH